MEKEKELRVKAKRVWNAMRYRCSLKDYGSITYAYRGVTICEEWMDFECFFEWFKNNYIDGFQIDKDILKKGNRVYCPEYCCFVPAFINSLFTKSNKIRGKYPVGVDFHCGKFRARVKKVINGKRGCLDLGYFNSPEEAFDAYKIEREKYFKETADKYKDVIPEKVYNAIVNYKVEYDD